ncbi:alpha/beta hydrolase family protein [Candidatus Poribacteria bacterium]|nr:alpha/beta hydrolase family protein [Candidatus Poribacteria bacterium]
MTGGNEPGKLPFKTDAMHLTPNGEVLTQRLKTLKSPRVPILPTEEFKIGRVGAAASVTLGGSVDDFLRELGVPTNMVRNMKEHLEVALAQYAHACRERNDVIQRWESVFWSKGAKNTFTHKDLVALEIERRVKSERCVKPVNIFYFLAKAPFIPMVKFHVPSPVEVNARWAHEIANPNLLYGAPDVMPDVETLRKILGPSGLEYIIRFKSLSRFANDVAYARVYEPENASDNIPTLIYGCGLAMAYDQVTYWPEEEYIARCLSARGYRVILMESPWHGRRAVPGYYGSELYFAAVPVSLFLLHAAQVQETAVTIQWARSSGASVVAVGGISLGGVVAQQVAGWCGTWPELMRPDIVFLGATCNRIDQVVLNGELSQSLGVNKAIRAAGWTEAGLENLRIVLDPPSKPGIPPDRILGVLGCWDTAMPYQFAMEMLREWEIPDENITTWQVSHFGFVSRLFRTMDFQNLIMQVMDRARR